MQPSTALWHFSFLAIECLRFFFMHGLFQVTLQHVKQIKTWALTQLQKHGWFHESMMVSWSGPVDANYPQTLRLPEAGQTGLFLCFYVSNLVFDPWFLETPLSILRSPLGPPDQTSSSCRVLSVQESGWPFESSLIPPTYFWTPQTLPWISPVCSHPLQHSGPHQTKCWGFKQRKSPWICWVATMFSSFADLVWLCVKFHLKMAVFCNITLTVLKSYVAFKYC